MPKRVLIISQAISQDYYHLLCEAFPEGTQIDLMTGSEISGTSVIKSPAHDPSSVKARLRCWADHYRFVTRWARKHRDRKYDLIYCVSNPPVNSYLGIKLKKIFKAKLIYMNWDLYPQMIETLMHGKASRIASVLWNRWNEHNFRKIDQIITIGEVVKESIQKRIPYDLGIRVVPISVDTDLIRPVDHGENPFIRENNLGGKFIILYSGKMGKGHNIEIILEAAKKLEDNGDLVFVFIGYGEKVPLVQKHIREGQTNVRYFPMQPPEVFPYSIASGDIGIVSQERSSARYFMPSKTYSMMAAGEMILGICSRHDDLQRLIENTGIGITVKNNSADTLKDRILKLYHMNQTPAGKDMKNKSRKVAEECYSNQVVIGQYREIFDEYLS